MFVYLFFSSNYPSEEIKIIKLLGLGLSARAGTNAWPTRPETFVGCASRRRRGTRERVAKTNNDIKTVSGEKVSALFARARPEVAFGGREERAGKERWNRRRPRRKTVHSPVAECLLVSNTRASRYNNNNRIAGSGARAWGQFRPTWTVPSLFGWKTLKFCKILENWISKLINRFPNSSTRCFDCCGRVTPYSTGFVVASTRDEQRTNVSIWVFCEVSVKKNRNRG